MCFVVKVTKPRFAAPREASGVPSVKFALKHDLFATFLINNIQMRSLLSKKAVVVSRFFILLIDGREKLMLRIIVERKMWVYKQAMTSPGERNIASDIP